MKLTPQMEKWCREQLKKANVIGYSSTLKPKIKAGKELDTLAIRFYVTKKISIEKLSNKDLIPPFQAFGKQIVQTDIIEIGTIKALEDIKELKKARHRPMPLGVSIGHPLITAGTAGWLGKKDGKLMIVTNNHVAAAENKAQIGDIILQPGPSDGGSINNPEDRIGRLYYYVPVSFEEFTCKIRQFLVRKLLRRRALPNKVDIALVEVDEKDILKRFIDSPPPLGITQARVGMKCMKTGRTTCLTKGGTIIDTDWTGMVQYSRGIALFEDQILIEGEGFSAGGDSGSCVMDMDRNIIGLLFAGSNTHTVVNKENNCRTLAAFEWLI